MNRNARDYDDENTGPSVDSRDPDERIAARRLRIQRRIEQQQQEALGETIDAVKDQKEEFTVSRQQIDDSRKRLGKLTTDGTELVSNIKIASDSREAHRRREDSEIKKNRVDKLEAEAKAGMERFDGITKRWVTADNKKIPQELQELLLQQKAACDAMVDEKNKLIDEFQKELKIKDDYYVKDLKKQAEDIDLLVERCEEQIQQLTRAYREELTVIEKAFLDERKSILGHNKSKWEELMDDKRHKEVVFMEERQRRVDNYETQLKNFRTQDAEEYNAVKIKMETDVAILEQQLQQMKATYQLNQEKLEYNFQVLKKRDEENTITKSQQKRRITKLQDVLNQLKNKMSKSDKFYRDENGQLRDDYNRITQHFYNLQKKSQHFVASDAQKFYDIWIMQEEEAKKVAKDLLEADRLIHEQQLGLDWVQPDLDYLDNVGPPATKLETQVTASEIAKRVFASEEGSNVELDGVQFSVPTIKNILELLSNESGFLVEEKLLRLLQPLDTDERNLMKLDTIFAALGIENEDDVKKLTQYFVLTKQEFEPLDKQLEDGDSKEGSVASELASVGGKSESRDGEGRSRDGEGRSRDGEGRSRDGEGRSRDEEGRSRDEEGRSRDEEGRSRDDSLADEEEVELATPSEEVELVHANDVVVALRKFVEDHKKLVKEMKSSTFQLEESKHRDNDSDTIYWLKLASTIDGKQEKVWSSLLDGATKYYHILSKRSGLLSDVDKLTQQNGELRLLLSQYMNSRVNQELEVPPTKVMQLDGLLKRN